MNDAKTIFRAWELLRIPYNFILICETLIILSSGGSPRYLWTAYLCVSAGIIANVLFMLGPATEAYASWLGYKSKKFRWALFGLGLTFSIAVTGICVSMYMFHVRFGW